MKRSSYSALPSTERLDRKFESQIEMEEDTRNHPMWTSFRSKIFSFSRSTRSKSPGTHSPRAHSPCNRSPTRKDSSKSPTPNKSPTNKSPTNRSPTIKPSAGKSPTSGTWSPPNKSPTIKSPTARWPPPLIKHGSFSRGSKDSPMSSVKAENPPVQKAQPKAKKCLKKTFSLNLEDEEVKTEEVSGSPGTNSPSGTGGKRVKLKLKGSPIAESVVEMSQLDEDDTFATAALKSGRKWSYHGTTNPGTPIEAPKRHSFSTGSAKPEEGIVVSNNDLLTLLGTQNRLTPPNIKQLEESVPIPTPKPRGRSQSIAFCAEPSVTDNSGEGPHKVPITIRRTDCDHVSIQNDSPSKLEVPNEEEEIDDVGIRTGDLGLVWDASGSLVNVDLIGSAIEKYLKTKDTEEESEDIGTSLNSLQVK